MKRDAMKSASNYYMTSTEGDLFAFHSHLFIKLRSAEPISFLESPNKANGYLENLKHSF